MPHVAVLFEFPTLNGGEHSMLAVLARLQQEGHFRFTAIAPPVGPLADELQKLAIPIAAFECRDGNKSKRPATQLHEQLSKVLAALKPDVLHANSLSMSRLTGQPGFAEVANCVRSGHLRDIIKLNKTVIADLNRNDALVAVSRATRDFHVAQGLAADRCHVIHNGVDTDRFQPRGSSAIRSLIFPEVPEDASVLLSVGQICLRKGQLNIAKAVCTLLKSRDDVYLAIAGERHSGKAESIAYEQSIRRELEAIGKPQHLLSLGYRHDIPALMNRADLLVHAAHQEPFGRTLLEAAASGLPIVATDVGGTAEMLRHDQDALLVPPNDVAAMKTAIERVLADDNRAADLADSARQHICTHFTVDAAATNLADFWLGSS